MVNKELLLKIGQKLLRTAMIFCWLFLLRYTIARPWPYYLLAGAALVLTLAPSEKLNGRQRIWANIGSGFLAFAVALANYRVYTHVYQGLLCFVCGFAAADVLFRWLIPRSAPGFAPRQYPVKPWMVWTAAMAVFSAVDLVILRECYFPAVATPDTIWQIEQFLTGVYTNHHPFYHTQLVRLFYTLGMALFGSANPALMLFAVFQILAMSAVFAYVVVTLYQTKLPLLWVLLCGLWFAALPAHVMYSFTVWKDVLWSGMVALFLTALFRIFFGLGEKKWLNVLFLTLGSLGFCLLRNNGWLAFAFFTLLFVIVFLRRYPRLCALFAAVAGLCWVMNGPVLDALGVEPSPVLESLAIPTQQIGLVIAEGNPLTPEQTQLLSQAVEVEKIREAYSPTIVDPIKIAVRTYGSEDVIAENTGAFGKLWLQLGLRHPWTYVRAWIDQTAGYWNGGYHYWVWEGGIYANDLGLAQHIRRPGLFQLWQTYLGIFETTPLSLFISIGFHVWLVAGAFILNAANKRWRAAFLAIPLLAIVGTLMVATPVFSEFRYAYAVFTALPIVLASAVCREETPISNRKTKGE